VKYADIAEAATKLAPQAAILTGNVRSTDLPGFEWQPPVHLPWGKHRLLWLGRNRSVSRGTS
jgi:hypothetical protein